MCFIEKNRKVLLTGGSGKLQEEEGPPAAEEMLTRLGFERKVTERVCYLVGHHHTYTHIDGADYQILVEADFLVNLYKDQIGKNSAESVLDKIFRTGIGRKICEEMFALHEGGRMLESDTAVSITGQCSRRQ